MSAPNEAVQGEHNEATAQFDWHRQWYPLMVVEDADTSIPHARKLLGKDLVLWCDKAGTWRCFEDRCPHRLAPLSEGRIDNNGDLYCNFHGWAFSGAGNCTSIPQISGEQAGAQLNSPRACAVTYPTRVAEGLVWVWASAGPGAEAEAAAAAWPGMGPSIDSHGDKAFISKHRWYFRDLPISYVAAKESSFNDPSHDTVLHHKCVPALDRKAAGPSVATLAEMDVTGYKVLHTRQGSVVGSPVVDHSLFPCGNTRTAGSFFKGLSYTVPAAEGHTYTFISYLKPLPDSQAPFNLMALLRKPEMLLDRLRWNGHLFTHSLIDADNAIQVAVDRNRARAGGNQQVYLPAESDRGPAACWAWLERFGGGGPPVSTVSRPVDLSRPEVPRRVLLDRFEQHTKHCKSCSQAHATFTKLAAAAQLLAAALAVAAIASLAAKGLTVAGCLMAVGAAVAAALHLGCAQLVQRFVFVDYDKHHMSKQP